MGKKSTEDAIADSQAARVMRVGSVAELLVELNADDVLAEATAAGGYPLSLAQREWVDVPAVGRELLVEAYKARKPYMRIWPTLRPPVTWPIVSTP